MTIRKQHSSCFQRLPVSSIACYLLLSMMSCTRTPPASPTPPPAGTGSLHVALSYPDGFNRPTDQVELIISETGGRILLDTLSLVNTTVTATLATNEKLIDVTTVTFVNNNYEVVTYKAVDPTTWPFAYAFNCDIGKVDMPATHNGYIYYTNPPVEAGMPYFFFNGYFDTGYTLSGSEGNVYRGVTYAPYVKNYLYLLYPTAGLYNLHKATSNSDTVDLSHMDTARTSNFLLSADDTLAAFSVVGVVDSTDATTTLLLRLATGKTHLL